MSIDQFMYSWKAGSYDKVECFQRDNWGNPLEVRFYRKGKRILTVFVVYDENGEWCSITSEKPAEAKKK